MHIFSIDVIDSYHGFCGLEPVWNGLLDASDLCIPQMTFEWFSCWWRSYGRGSRMLIAVVKEDGVPIAIAPLMRTRMKWHGLPVQAVTLMANGHSLRSGLILTRHAEEIVEYLLSYLQKLTPHCDLLLLDQFVKGSATDRGVRSAIRKHGMLAAEMPGDLSPYIPVAGSWDQYFKGRSRSFRKKMRVMITEIEKQPGYEVVRADGTNLPVLFDEMLAISQRTWKYREQTAIVNSDNDTGFYRLLAQAALAKGWLSFWILRIGGKPAAFVFNLEWKGKIFALKMGFNEDFAALSPGKYLDYYTIRHSFENGAFEFDLMGKNEPFKMRWTSAFRDQRKFMIFSPTFYGRTLYLLKSVFSRKTQRAAAAGEAAPEQRPLGAGAGYAER